jgi:hypothetical protein
VDVPEILESVCRVNKRFCGCSRKSGIAVFVELQIPWPFQQIWKCCSESSRGSMVVTDTR